MPFLQSIKDIMTNYSWLLSSCSALASIILGIAIKRNEMKYADKLKKERLNFNSKLKKNENIYQSSINALTSNNNIYSEESLKSLKTIWTSYLEIKEFYSSIAFVYSILKPDEYNTFVFSPRFNNKSINDDKFNKFIKKIEDKTNAIKPFAPSELWYSFSYYKTFVMRSYYIFIEAYKNKNLEAWYIDKNLVKIKDTFLGENFKYKNEDFNTFQLILFAMEEKVTSDFRNFLSGEKLSDDIINKHISIEKQLSEAK